MPLTHEIQTGKMQLSQREFALQDFPFGTYALEMFPCGSHIPCYKSNLAWWRGYLRSQYCYTITTSCSQHKLAFYDWAIWEVDSSTQTKLAHFQYHMEQMRVSTKLCLHFRILSEEMVPTLTTQGPHHISLVFMCHIGTLSNLHTNLISWIYLALEAIWFIE